MCGYNVLWLPGTDHASIATEMLVNRHLKEQGIDRNEIGREKFLEHAWAWKEKYGGTIIGQFKRIGASCDWSRERFTMDEGLSRAVRETFVRLYEKGLIYRGEYLVNWCPGCGTAVSDLEVVYSQQQGHLWHIRYPVTGSRRVSRCRHYAPRNDARRHGRRGQSRTTTATSTSGTRPSRCRWSAAS